MTIITKPAAPGVTELRNFMTVHMKQHPFIFSDEKKYRLRRHAAFWAFWWIFFGILYSYTAKISLLPNFKRLPIALLDSFFFLSAHVFLSYSLMYYVIPSLLLKGKYVKTTWTILLLFFLTACISALIGTYVLPVLRYNLFGIPFSDPANTSYLLSLLAGLRGAITVGGLAAAIKLMKYWYVKEQRNLQLEKENVAAQLQLLKAQVHPHFLFNTLNNIYSFTQNSSPEAAKMITGLSDLLRYMLYEGNRPLVPLAKELEMIKDYIGLEKTRYGNKLELHLDLPADTNGLYIAPLLLLPLVENCFKHGTSQVLEQPWVNLQVVIKDRQLQMKLLNGKVKEKNDEPVHAGIGIKNVQKRLSLLYPGHHEMTITNEEEVFIVNLKIELEQIKGNVFKTAPVTELQNV